MVFFRHSCRLCDFQRYCFTENRNHATCEENWNRTFCKQTGSICIKRSSRNT